MIKTLNAPLENKHLYFVALIGLGFLWTGTAYIIQAYRVFGLMEGESVNLLVSGAYYICQALGVGLVALVFLKRPSFAGGRLLPFHASLLVLFSTGLSLFSSSLGLIIFMGSILNVGIGILSACYLTRLSTDIPQERRGLVFGLAYAFGSLGTWILSLPMGGRFLWDPRSFFPLGLMGGLSLVLLVWLPKIGQTNLSKGLKQSFEVKDICLAGGVLFLLSLQNTLGFSFPLKGAADHVYIEFTRVFYGLGLIIAGLVSDKNRRWGAVSCLAGLAFPFAALSLGSSLRGESLMWVLAYIFLGFWSVYRILVFADISDKSKIPALAVVGLLVGRLGEATGTLGAHIFSGTPLIIVSGLLFAVMIGFFFVLYQKLYNTVISPEEAEKLKLGDYVNRFGLSAREEEVFSLIIKGMSNSEISAALYISESTVKFHVGNIFKKTGLTSRLELTADYKLGKSK